MNSGRFASTIIMHDRLNSPKYQLYRFLSLQTRLSILIRHIVCVRVKTLVHVYKNRNWRIVKIYIYVNKGRLLNDIPRVNYSLFLFKFAGGCMKEVCWEMGETKPSESIAKHVRDRKHIYEPSRNFVRQVSERPIEFSAPTLPLTTIIKMII